MNYTDITPAARFRTYKSTMHVLYKSPQKLFINHAIFVLTQWRRQGGGGKRGRLPPPNVEKDGPRNSSKFDEKIWGGVGIHLRCEKIINTKYF